MKKISIAFAFLLFSIGSYAQVKKIFTPADIDSLKVAVKKQKDTSEVKTLLNLSLASSTVDPQKAIEYANEAIKKAIKINYKKGEVKGYTNLGGIYLRLSDFKQSKRYIDTTMLLAKEINYYELIVRSYHNYGTYFYYHQQYDSAIYSYQKALDLAFKKFNDTITIGKLYNNIASCFNLSGNYKQSLTYYLKSLKLNEIIKDNEGITMANGNIGVVYFYMKNYKEAEKYFTDGLKMALKMNNKYQMSAITLSLGAVYKDTKQFEKAQVEFKKAYELKKEIGDKNGQGMILVNLGELYSDMGDLVNALINFKKAEDIAIEIKNYQIELYSYNCQANVYSKKNDIVNASKKYESAISIAEKLNLKPDLIEIYKSYAKANANAGKFEKAFKYHELFSTLKDSIFTSENAKSMAEMSSKYDSEKKQSQIELLNKDKEKQEAISAAESKKQKIIIGSVTTGLLLVLLLALFIFRSYRQKQKANVEITLQKEIIEERNREVRDSITYAKRIQTAILPSDKLVKEFLSDSFILFKPKDIVSGDFYWMEKIGEKIFYAVVDCTGHGVPGAMVSVVGHNALNRTIKEFGLTEPAAILDKLTELVEETFEKSESEVKDGMDISLCCLDLNMNQLKWAGANNPIWIHSKGEIQEIKADKQPIGKFDYRKPFTGHTIELEKGDTIYIFTDGFADQFGGDKGKKFKYQQLKSFILTLQNKKMDEQKEILNNRFESWRGELEQVDDVCLVGVRV